MYMGHEMLRIGHQTEQNENMLHAVRAVSVTRNIAEEQNASRADLKRTTRTVPDSQMPPSQYVRRGTFH